MQQQQENPTKTLKPVKVLGPCATRFTSANTGSWRLERPQFDPANCIKCGICVRSCPLDIITLDKENEDQIITIDWYYCKGCGLCSYECPKDCLPMVDEKGAE